MGTSSAYSSPTGGDWTKLKSRATRFAHAGPSDVGSPRPIFESFVAALGGTAGASESSSAGKSVAQALAAFVGDVASSGFTSALQARGLGDLVGEPARVVLAGLLDAFASSSNELEQSAAREALADVESEILEKCDTFEELEEQMERFLDADGLAALLASFLTSYIFKRLLQVIKDRLQARSLRIADANALEVVIKDYITDKVGIELGNINIETLDWAGAAGAKLVEKLFRDGYDIVAADEQ